MSICTCTCINSHLTHKCTHAYIHLHTYTHTCTNMHTNSYIHLKTIYNYTALCKIVDIIATATYAYKNAFIPAIKSDCCILVFFLWFQTKICPRWGTRQIVSFYILHFSYNMLLLRHCCQLKWIEQNTKRFANYIHVASLFFK